MLTSAFRWQVVAKILAKALMSIPSTDFLLCTYLISEQIKVDAVVESLYQLSNMLEQAEFKEFWKTYTNCAASPLLAAIPDFEDKMCEFVLGLLTASHQSLGVHA
jgi:translation initiation factor 3 subunit K